MYRLGVAIDGEMVHSKLSPSEVTEGGNRPSHWGFVASFSQANISHRKVPLQFVKKYLSSTSVFIYVIKRVTEM